MEIEVLVVPNCPHRRLAERRLRQAVAAAGRNSTAVNMTVIADQVQRSGFTGSRTLLINGCDPFVEPGAVPSLVCRTYQSLAGPVGAPDIDQLRHAVRVAAVSV